jgi:hypothetical protein
MFGLKGKRKESKVIKGNKETRVTKGIMVRE